VEETAEGVRPWAPRRRPPSGLIWHYFADKGELMKQAVVAAVQAIQGEMAAELDHAAPEALFRRGQAEGLFRSFDMRVMAVTYQGAIDMMLSYVDSHPDTDIDRYADALAGILLAAMAR
jgi:AcrR family transcriptional regulator